MQDQASVFEDGSGAHGADRGLLQEQGYEYDFADESRQSFPEQRAKDGGGHRLAGGDKGIDCPVATVRCPNTTILLPFPRTLADTIGDGNHPYG